MKLPDREIELFPIRHITAILNPRKDQLLLTQQLGPGLDPVISRIDGSDQHNVFQRRTTLSPGTSLAWSRDGEWIAFTDGDSRGTPSGQADIVKMRSDGTALQNLTRDSGASNTHPTFSGNGKQIVFRRGASENHGLYLMDADGNNVRRLTNERADHLFPAFSPTAQQVAFITNRDNRELQRVRNLRPRLR
jgi:Tol biopolymer transport system component